FQQVYGRGIEDEVLAPLTYITDADSRGDDAASADAATWVVPGQAQGSFRHALRVRAAALANFSASTVPPGSDAHDLAHAFTLAYLVHRHETVGLSKLIGGQRRTYARVAHGEFAGVETAVPALEQREALESLAR